MSTTYVPVTLSDLTVNYAVRQSLFVRLAGNPTAIAQSGPDAPYNESLWFPYDGVTVGDGATGTFYDYAVDGALVTVESPTFVDGYDYALQFIGTAPSGGSNLLDVDLYYESGALWQTLTSVDFTAPATKKYHGMLAVDNTRLASIGHVGNWISPYGFIGGTILGGAAPVTCVTPTAVLDKPSKFRVDFKVTCVDGSLRLLKRRNVLTD